MREGVYYACHDVKTTFKQYRGGNFEVVGGGGTCFLPLFQAINETRLKFDAIVIFTDGYIYDLEEVRKHGCKKPVIWIISEENNNGFTPPFGKMVKYKPIT